jgi:hypothetical protein
MLRHVIASLADDESNDYQSGAGAKRVVERLSLNASV